MQFLVNAFPTATRVKVMRRRVLQHDLDMYAAISGKSPGIRPAPAAPEQSLKVHTSARAKPWSASVLANCLTHLGRPRQAVRVGRPEVADWVRRLSNQALERLQEAHGRLDASRQSTRVQRATRIQRPDKGVN